MIADVLVEITSAWISKTFSYIIPSSFNIKKGVRVIVPFGKKHLEGFVINIRPFEKQEYELKEIIDVIDDEPVLNDELMDIGKYISSKYYCSLIKAYQTMLPVGFKAKSDKIINKKYNSYIMLMQEPNFKLNSTQEEIIKIVKEKNKVKKELLSKISTSSLNTLIKKNILKEIKEEYYRLDNETSNRSEVMLTSKQQEVADKIWKSKNHFKPFLLHGVTGSGKTEIYINLVKRVINENKNVILLVPEISLTPQMIERFKGIFGKTIAVLHSGLSDGEKYDEWRKIRNGDVSIVIGARSAIFAPFKSLGMIIIDEEHSDTYKQENNPKYNAIDIGIFRCKNYNIPLVLGSATPQIESYTRAKMGLYELLELNTRVNAKLPKVKLVDMKNEIKKGNRFFSEHLKNELNECLKNNHQAIILLNRRGYATTVSCHECGKKFVCPKCDIPLTYHKKGNYLMCHYCSYKTYKPTICPDCHSENINEFGLGTEKLEEEIIKEFKSAKVIRMDVDTTSRKGSHEKIINDFKNQKYNILLGTQMISKGLNFENVTVVGVINADSSLNIPDFRSAERTFDLLSQVAGRAGRSKYPGKVIMQGFNMDHYSIIFSSMHDYYSFYKEEMNIRKSLNYPPYYNLCVIKTSSNDNKLLYDENNKIVNFLRKNIKSAIILGPSPCTIFKINNIYYYQIIIKYKKIEQINNELKILYEQYFNKKIKLDIDINPYHI